MTHEVDLLCDTTRAAQQREEFQHQAEEKPRGVAGGLKAADY
jgi:hypothetical protein